MKKTASMAIAALMVLCTAAFGCAAAAETAAESVIGTVLNGYQATYQAATQDLIADNGASFNLDDPENHHVIISVSDEGVTFEAEGMSSPQMG
jgi:ABC-type sugar transport system substrate-binding protein